MAVRTARATGSRTRAKRLVHDLLDGASAPAALRAAAQTPVNLSGRTRRQLGDAHGAAHVVVAQDIAGTNDHGEEGSLDGIAIGYSRPMRDAKEKSAFSSNSKL